MCCTYMYIYECAHQQERPSTSWNYPVGHAASEVDERNTKVAQDTGFIEVQLSSVLSGTWKGTCMYLHVVCTKVPYNLYVCVSSSSSLLLPCTKVRSYMTYV